MPCRISGSTRLCADHRVEQFSAHREPSHFKTLRSNFRLCPTFSIAHPRTTAEIPPACAAVSASFAGNRDIISRVRRKRKRDADQSRLSHVKARRFRVETKRLQSLQRFDQFRPLLGLVHQMIFVRHIGDGFIICGTGGVPRGVIYFAFREINTKSSTSLFRFGSGCGCVSKPRPALNSSPNKRRPRELNSNSTKRRLISSSWFADFKFVKFDGAGRVADDRGQPFGEERLLAMRFEILL